MIASGFGFYVPALLSTFCMLLLLKALYEGNSKKGGLHANIALVIWTATSDLIGISLAGTANAIFPGIMLAKWVGC